MEGETQFALEIGPAAELPAPVRNHAAEGVALGILAYAWWGSLFPIFIWVLGHEFAHVGALEIVTHRVIWGLPILAIILTATKKWGTYFAVFRTPATLGILTATTILIGLNWFAYTHAIATNQASAASLGYYINPLFSVALGMIFLGERARPMQWLAFAFAAAGVIHETILGHGLPWLSLTMAISFGFYGLLRKQVKADAAVGLAVEMTLLYIPACAILAWFMANHRAAFLGAESPWWVSLGVTVSGFMTVIPLVMYTAAARRLRLATMGFLQYIAPTGQFILAVTLFGEHFDPRRLITFACIWVGLAIFSVDSVRAAKRIRA